MKSLVLIYLPSIISLTAIVLGIWYSSRHAEHMQRERFEQDDLGRKRDTLLKTGEELYQLLRMHAHPMPGRSRQGKADLRAGPLEEQSAQFLALEKEKEEHNAASERIHTLVRIYHLDLEPYYLRADKEPGGH
jgi:hypothetical protein